jgi:putative ABC transport system permease protein
VATGSGNSARLVSAVRGQVATLDKQVPVYEIAPVEDLVTRSVARQRFDVFLLALFASVALVLAAVGIYGVLGFTVSCRTKEIGIRLALGATPASTMALLVSQGMKLVLFGLATGMITSLLMVRLIRGLLFQVSPADPPTYAATAMALALTGALA